MSEFKWRHFDLWLLSIVMVLTIFSIAMIDSSIAGNIEVADYPYRQLVFAAGGIVALFIMALVDYRLWSSLSRPIYIITVASLMILSLVGENVFGSNRWFRIAGFSIQPSEFAKVAVILVLSNFLAKNRDKIDDLKIVIQSFLLVLGVVVWVFLQPDLSTSLVIMAIWFALLYAVGLRAKNLVYLILIVIFTSLVTFPLLEDYQLSRVASFLVTDLAEATYGELYNIRQALISIGSGGWFGQGYGQGPQVQLRFLKLRWSDFIFSVIAHEFGFVGAVILILLLVFVIYRCLRAARLARDIFGALICYGVAILIALQTFANIGVNLNILPPTGLPLPFISYGGSALLSLFIGIGLVQSVIMRHKPISF